MFTIDSCLCYTLVTVRCGTNHSNGNFAFLAFFLDFSSFFLFLQSVRCIFNRTKFAPFPSSLGRTSKMCAASSSAACLEAFARTIKIFPINDCDWGSCDSPVRLYRTLSRIGTVRIRLFFLCFTYLREMSSENAPPHRPKICQTEKSLLFHTE